MISVGIDIGTTTTQLIFSEVAVSAHPLQPQIMPLKVLYRSPIHFTPLHNPATIATGPLLALLQAEYATAAITPADVELGAIIITGETARKENASAVLQAVAGLAGDFVVAIAGPHLESSLAGRGSGAAAYSQSHFTAVTNLDIGGGTTNIARFVQGELAQTSALNIGGRLLTLSQQGIVQTLAPAAQTLIAALDLPLQVGQPATLPALRRLTDTLADLIFDHLAGRTSPLQTALQLTPPLTAVTPNERISFSGGVGHLIAHPQPINCLTDVLIHGDFGPLLAESLRAHPDFARASILTLPETLRATVLGAAVHSVSLSGRTIWLDDGILPLKNVPVVRVRWTAVPPSPAHIPTDLAAACAGGDIDPAADLCAFFLPLTWPLDFATLTQLAAGLAEFRREITNHPFILLLEPNYARVLGQLLHSALPAVPLVILDQIPSQSGDILDLAEPLLGGEIVPLSLKTLLFYS